MASNARVFHFCRLTVCRGSQAAAILQQPAGTCFILKPWSEAVTGFFTMSVAIVAINVHEDVRRSYCQTFVMCLDVELSEDAQA